MVPMRRRRRRRMSRRRMVMGSGRWELGKQPGAGGGGSPRSASILALHPQVPGNSPKASSSEIPGQEE